jgi:hypothetical protein
MTASRWQYFFASGWPLVIWFGSFAFAFVTVVARLFGWPTQFDSVGMLLSWIAGIVAAALSGLLVATVLSWVVVRPLYRYRARLNGAPFQVGDHVEVLAGRDRGSVAAIYELWPERRQVRVDLGEVSRASVQDVFAETSVRRADRASE